MAGLYDPERPVIVPVQEDKRYRSWKQKAVPKSTAVIIYMMDVSGSMGNEQKEIVRIESFWIDTWLRSQYREIETRYIVHDATAREVDQHTFFHIREAGGRRSPPPTSSAPRSSRRTTTRRGGTSTRSTSPTGTTGAATTPRCA